MLMASQEGMQKEQVMRRSLFRRSDLWYTLFVVGIVAALAGFGAALLVFQLLGLLGPQRGWIRPISAQLVIPLAAALSSLLIGPFFWWRLISKPRALTVRRGISCGVLGSLVAHPLTWCLVTAFYALTNTDHVATSLGVVLFVAGLLDVPFWSLIYLGWFTALIGGVTGAILVVIQRNLPGQASRSTAL
jgi:hypothetical protein